MHPVRALRAVAVFEAAKGLLALAAASGVLLLLHHDLRALALRLVEHLHLNPAAKVPHLLLHAVDRLQDMRVGLLVLGVIAYVALRLVEAYGLWHGRAWAEVVAALSGAVYLPIELLEAVRRPGWLSATAVLLNAAVVALMLGALWRRRQGRPAAAPPA
ncbi:DUF2127 domain-containing protein [Pseudorhodoferax sp. Leaf267]|uniref:DUF2127 domain-containing protein n=1 Tax=Pseudorhodoferax sp. Leaf267 TaxID=1736316 RepID=UPI0012E1A499|nr:DUF2127 domain-containing protein [Pseudorhodoferax sp. Leaf267]